MLFLSLAVEAKTLVLIVSWVPWQVAWFELLHYNTQTFIPRAAHSVMEVGIDGAGEVNLVSLQAIISCKFVVCGICKVID